MIVTVFWQVDHIIKKSTGGRRGCDRIIVGFTTTYVIGAYHHKRCEFEHRAGEVYSIQQYEIKFARDLRQVGGFLWGLPISSSDKTDRHAISEILLKVVLNLNL